MKFYNFKIVVMLLVLISFTSGLVLRADQINNDEGEYPVFNRLNLEGRIVFVVKLGGRNHYDLWIMNADGSNIRHLTDNPGNEVQPSISPDGEFVAFAHDNAGDWRIQVMEIDTGKRRDITGCCANQQNPDWGENGMIAYDSDQHGNFDIFMQDPFDPASEQKQVQLTSDPGNEKQPAWSKGARLLAYVSDKDTKPLRHIRILDLQDGNKDNWQDWQVTPQGDSPVFYTGKDQIYPSAVPGIASIAYVAIKGQKPIVRWTTVDGASGGEISERPDGDDPPAINPAFNFYDLNTIGYVNPKNGKLFAYNIESDKSQRAERIFSPRMIDPIRDFDWGSYGNSDSGRGQGYTQQGKDMLGNQGENRNEQNRTRENEDRIRQGDQRKEMDDREREMRMQDEKERMEMEAERRALELKSERERLNLDDERRKSQLEMRRQEMEMDQQRKRESNEMEDERRRREQEDRVQRQEMERQRSRMEREGQRGGQRGMMGSALYPDGSPPTEAFRDCVGRAFGGPPPGDFVERWPTQEEFKIMIDAGCEPGLFFGNIYGNSPNLQRSYVRGASKDQYDCMIDNLGEFPVKQFEMRDPRPDEVEKIASCEGVPELFGFEVFGEDDRGFFGKPRIGQLKTGGPSEMLRDPTMLAVVGLVVTVGATLLQMARGK